MISPAHKYDVGISFLFADEALAMELHNLLSSQLDVFVFSKKQEVIAGTNGLETLREPFRTESRIVVALYRDGWGKTPWTGVEETAITDRALKEGWDWLLFVMLDATSRPPKWLPETRIRMSLPDYGLDGVVGAIKARAQEAGSSFRKDDAIEQAKRLERRAAQRRDREQRLGSHEGVGAAEKEVKAVFAEVERLVAEIARQTPTLRLQAGTKYPSCVITNETASVTLYWDQRYSNTLNESGLAVREFIGRVGLPQQQGILLSEPQEIVEQFYEFDLTPEHGWVLAQPAKRSVRDRCGARRLVRDTSSEDRGGSGHGRLATTTQPRPGRRVLRPRPAWKAASFTISAAALRGTFAVLACQRARL